MPKEKKFEEYMQELSEVVKQLENKENTLDDALSLFETGVHLTKKCQSMLDEAEQKVEVLLEDEQGNMKVEPFVAEGDNE